jgi:hypothetical protein
MWTARYSVFKRRREGQGLTELLVSLLHFYEKGLLEFKNVLEILALAEAKKNVVRLILKDEHAGQVSKTICAALPEITCKPSKFGLRTSFATSDWDFFQERVTDGNHEERAFFYGTEEAAEAAKALEDDGASPLALGRSLGIPDCCGESYAKITNETGQWMPAYLDGCAGITEAPRAVNRFSSLSPPHLGYHLDYFPCSPRCPLTLETCDANRKLLLQLKCDALVDEIDKLSGGIALLVDDCAYYLAKDISHHIQRGLLDLTGLELQPLNCSGPKVNGISWSGGDLLVRRAETGTHTEIAVGACCFT